MACLEVLAAQSQFDVVDASPSLIVCNNYMDLCKGHTTLIFNVDVNIMVPVSLHKSIILSCAPCRRSQVGSGPTVPNQSREALLWLDSMMIMWSFVRSYWSCIPTDGVFCTPLTSTKVCGHVYVSYSLPGRLAGQVPMVVTPAGSSCAASCKCFTVRQVCQSSPQRSNLLGVPELEKYQCG
jgi:hypothetical protein